MTGKSLESLRLSLLEGRFAVCRLGADADVTFPTTSNLFSVTRTTDELSVVCEESEAPKDSGIEGGWRALKVEGPLEFSLTGVISSLTKPLADAEVPVFVISTFDTDYLLVKDETLERAISVLSEAGFRVKEKVI